VDYLRLMAETVLVSGANGFIGSHVLRYFQKKGYQVRALVRHNSDLHLIKDIDCHLVYGDLVSGKDLQHALTGVDLVIHVAGLASDWGSWEDFAAVNIAGAKHIFRAAAAARCRRFVHISSVAIHGFGRRHVSEDDGVNGPLNAYAESKRQIEEWLFAESARTELQVCAVRPGNVFGPDDHTFIDKFLAAICEGKMALVGGGRALTCPTYIENLVAGIFLAATKTEAAGQAFLITDGGEITWRDFTTAFARALGRNKSLPTLPYGLAFGAATVLEGIYRLLAIRQPPLLTRYRIRNAGLDYHFTIAKAKRLLGYKVQVDFNEAVRRTVEWYLRENRC
jgi:nucleoside-diphosphate-sugar epimerase